eukprot:CAMPEP_0115061270 /NCGR_PEP_ID=MMETSP0227-20121206/7913_1 /TAXON_ID=89957 /ORGANISM="Polarella glacialis, Strain CCMP 1383" /LENGTH=96 /DNA_ID=CAMNT_0002446551 /DNA_START=430 /DNA_END=717 /DNA_ORIENTATION=+
MAHDPRELVAFVVVLLRVDNAAAPGLSEDSQNTHEHRIVQIAVCPINKMQLDLWLALPAELLPQVFPPRGHGSLLKSFPSQLLPPVVRTQMLDLQL